MKLIIVTTVFVLLGAALPSHAQAAVTHYDLNIPREPLDRALKQLAEQTGLQVARFSDVTQGTSEVGPVVGHFTTEEALTSLLTGSGLSYRVLSHRTIAIVRAPAGGAGSSRAGTAHRDDPKAQRSFSGPFRMAQVAQGATAGHSTVTQAARPTTEEESRPAFNLREIIVTAQKYAQPAFDVPISMTVIGGAELQRLGVTNLANLQFSVPGMLVEDTGTNLRITLQGMGNLFGQWALVGSYLDDADVTSENVFGLDLTTYDLERVEVLKGPQGTLYGEGSLGGAVRYITNKPILDEFQLLANVTATFDQYGAPGDRVEAVVNTPLLRDVMGLRVAADLDHEGGWIDQPAANQKNINSKDLVDIRIEGRWKPVSDLTVDAMEVVHRGTLGPFTGASQSAVYTQFFNLVTTPKTADNYNMSNVTVRWYAGSVGLVNSSTYLKHTSTSSNWGQSLQETPPPSPRFDYYYPSATTADESFSDEFRLSGNADGLWHWTLGAFYKRMDDDTLPFSYYFGVPGPPESPLPVPGTVFVDVLSKATSIFGDTNYRLFHKLILGVGARYFRDNESALIIGDTSRESQTFTSTDPRIYARYEISRNVNVYANVAKGFRSGGFNGLGLPQYEPEHAWTDDLGIKMRLWHDHITLDSDVFLSNYGGYQIIGFLPPPAVPLGITRNAGDARVKGLEAAVAWSPNSRWRVSVNGDYINARFVHIDVLGSAYEVGDPLDLVPRYQVTASMERDFILHGRAGFARLDYTQRARETFRNRSIGPWYYSQSSYMYLLGFRTGIKWRRNLALELFARNLLNERGYTTADVVEDFAPLQEPRTFGVEFEARFE